jgi:hypothetical protein
LNKAKDANSVKETFFFMFLKGHFGPAHLVGLLVLNFNIFDVYQSAKLGVVVAEGNQFSN